jgi:Rhomboid family
VHLSWAHFVGNSVFLVIFGYLAAYQGLGKFVGVTAVVMVTNSLHWWLAGTAGLPAAGASGMIWRWVGYSLFRWIFHRDELAFEAIVPLAVIYAVTSLDLGFPGDAEWQAHTEGLLGGVLNGLAFGTIPPLLRCAAAGRSEARGKSQCSPAKYCESDLVIEQLGSSTSQRRDRELRSGAGPSARLASRSSAIRIRFFSFEKAEPRSIRLMSAWSTPQRSAIWTWDRPRFSRNPHQLHGERVGALEDAASAFPPRTPSSGDSRSLCGGSSFSSPARTPLAGT